MKKSLFLAMAAVVLLSGCSKDDGGISITEKGNDLNSDAVEIHLGMNLPTIDVAPKTRAVIEDGTNWNGLQVGIYALAKNDQVNSTELTWINNDLSQRLLDNLTGTISSGSDPSINLGGTYYYPMSQGMNYTFYGYYPRVETPTIADKTIVASYDISGQEDILWGRAVAETKTTDGVTYEGYNARYFRKNTGTANPSIEFQHKLVRLNFKLKAGTEGGGTTEAAKVKVKSINVICQNRKVNLTVADKTKMNNTADIENGELATTTISDDPVFVKDNPDVSYCLPLYQTYTSSTSNEIYAGNPTDTPSSIGLPIMLPAPGLAITGETAYYVKIELEASAAQTLSTILPVSTTGGFLAGYQYDVTLIVNGLTDIKIDATLKAWQNGTNPDDVEIN